MSCAHGEGAVWPDGEAPGTAAVVGDEGGAAAEPLLAEKAVEGTVGAEEVGVVEALVTGKSEGLRFASSSLRAALSAASSALFFSLGAFPLMTTCSPSILAMARRLRFSALSPPCTVTVSPRRRAATSSFVGLPRRRIGVDGATNATVRPLLSVIVNPSDNASFTLSIYMDSRLNLAM